MGLEAVRCLLKNNPSVTASLCHLPLYRGGNPSVRCVQLPLHLRTETSLRYVPVFRPAYSALPKRSTFSRFAAYEGELRMLLQTL